MVVTCPNCRSRYAVDPQAIGPAGRTVQCARCQHRWFQQVEGVHQTPDMVIRPVTAGASLPAVIPPKPSFGWKRAVAVAVALVVLLAAAMFAFREEIATIISYQARASTSAIATALFQTTAAAPAQSLARAQSVPRSAAAPPGASQPAATPHPGNVRPALVESARPQIEVDLTSSRIDVAEGRYVVRGQIVNNGTAAGSTTLLRLTFKHNEDVLAERSFPLIAGPLAPGARVAFNQPLDDPPVGTTDIVPIVE